MGGGGGGGGGQKSPLMHVALCVFKLIILSVYQAGHSLAVFFTMLLAKNQSA